MSMTTMSIPDGLQPGAPSLARAPRPLTPAERRYLAGNDRFGRRLGLVFGVGCLLTLLAVDVQMAGHPPKNGIGVFVLIFGNVVLLAPAALFLNEALRRGPDPARAEGWPRAGRHAGVHVLAGKPVRHELGGVAVRLPDGWSGPPHFGLGQYATVELCPALEDDSNPRLTRQVVSALDADGHRVRAVDPALVGTTAARPPTPWPG